MRTEIAEKIVGMDLSFIILIDDLDRLEPAQTVIYCAKMGWSATGQNRNTSRY